MTCPKDPNPRQGTETHWVMTLDTFSSPVRKTLIPDRGRKLGVAVGNTGAGVSPKDPNPRQGTETNRYAGVDSVVVPVRKTLIPDRGRKPSGPEGPRCRIAPSPKDPNPRQGTET